MSDVRLDLRYLLPTLLLLIQEFNECSQQDLVLNVECVAFWVVDVLEEGEQPNVEI